MSTPHSAERPKPVPVDADGIPDTLKTMDRWVVWRYVEDVDCETGQVDWDKPPVNARTGTLASSTNSKTWSTFAEARAAHQRGGLDGVGFVLRRKKGDDGREESGGLVGVDLDDCRDATTGEVADWAQTIIRELDTYTEVSPSGAGVRLFLFGDLPPHGRKKGAYENYQSGRYVTVTGGHVEGTPRTIEYRQEQLLRVHARVFGDGKPKAVAPRADWRAATLDDAELIRRASEAKNGEKFARLWRGEAAGHNSGSEADLALCNYLAFWCGPDEGRIADLFAQSGLYRSKWNREDYRKRTIGKALAGRTVFYDPNRGVTKGNGGNGHAHNGAAKGGSDESAPEPQTAARGAEAKPPQGGPDEHLTDLGNARRVVARHGQDLRHCHPWKAWSIWDGRRWAEDVTAEAVRRVKDTQGELYRFAASRIDGLGDVGDDAGRKARLSELMALIKHALKWEDAKRISACLDLAKSEPGVPVLTEDLDRDPMLLNVLNGTLDLRTGELRPHRRADLLTKLAPVVYDPSAQCPVWTRFLARILDGNDPLMRYLQRVVGYCLTGDVSEQAMWFLHGGGSNGKSTFLGVLLHLCGDYGMQSVSELLMAKDHEAHPAERAALFGKRLVATVETEEGKRMAEALMKQLTGGDRITARRMYKDFFEFTPTHKILLAANHKPTIRGTDRAVWRRIKLVPFTVTITEAEKDKALLDKLKAEGPGILAWAVRGCLDWRRDGLGEPEEVRRATAEYQAEQDTLGEFLDACCILHADASTSAAALLSAYTAWSGDKFMNPKKFGQRLGNRGFESKRQGKGWYYHGLGVRDGDGDGS